VKDDYLVERFVHNGRTVSIYYDNSPSSPRENDNLCHMVCWQRNYNLGDEQVREALTAREVVRNVKSDGEKILAMLPLHFSDGGSNGGSMRTGDSLDDYRASGWAYVTDKRAQIMGCVNGDKVRETARVALGQTVCDKAWFEKAIRDEVDEYDKYLQGQCYGYEVEGREGDDLDSCWGYIGDLDYVRSEAKQAAEHGDDPMTADDKCQRDAPYPHPAGCLGCRAARVCNACGAELSQDTEDGRCLTGVCETQPKAEVP
jgi:hypothetical protein